MKKRFVAATVLCVLVAMLAASFASAGVDATPSADGQTIVRVYYPDLATGNKVLLSFEPWLLETNYEQGYHVMQVTQPEIDRLVALGLRVEKDTTWQAPPVLESLPAGIESIPGYSCYRTVEETFAAAQALATAHPNLATWIDVGDSWLKSVGQGGYDMMVLKLTSSAIGGDKPKLFLNGAIHAREYATAELVTRFGEYLVNNYGVDADATWILDHHEVHLLLHTNPDGRKRAETGLSWRKNVNNNYCANTNNRGADLNRNFAFQWGCCGGSSGSPCDATYRGPSAGSEPETQAVQAYMDLIFPDQRGPNLTDPAPSDATGIYIDIHSYGRLVLWPWGFTNSTAPNATALQTLGRKFAYFNSHTPQQSYALYATDGTTDDHAYGKLGVAAYCFETGTAFFQSCTYFEGTLWPANLPALIYAAKTVRTPYMTPAGPDAVSLALSSGEVPAGTPVTLNGTINDTRYNNTNGTEPTQNVAAAEYYVDTPFWVGGAMAYAMSPSDGSFNATIEGVSATVDTTGMSTGRHILFVRGKDSSNNWGAFSAIFLTISGPPNPLPTAEPQSVTTDEDTAVAITLTGSDPEGEPITFSVQSGPSHGTLSGTAPNLIYTPAANYNGADSLTFVVNDGHANSAPATVSITVNPVNDAPVANPQSVSTEQDTPVGITLAGSDVDGDALTYTVVTQPVNGTLSGTAPALTYTPAASYTGSDGFTFLVSDGQVSSDPATVSIAVTEPPAGDIIWLSLSANATLPTVGTVTDEDVVALNTATGVYSWVFDGSDVGITTDIDAFDVLPDGHILMSFDANTSVTGVGTVADPDIVEFTPTSLGSTTAGTFTWKFDGSDVGLSSSSEDVDALYWMADGSLLVSIRDAFAVTGISGADEDLVRFTATSWGSTTAGTWSWYFDGSDVGLSSTSNEDVDGIWVDQALTPYPDIYLCTIGSFSVTGVSGANEDLFIFHPTALGSTTAGSYGPGLYLDGSLFGLGSYDVDAFDVQR